MRVQIDLMLATFVVMVACSAPRDYVVTADLPLADPARQKTIIVPGPWVKVPPVKGGSSSQDALVVKVLRALLALPGATQCEAGMPSDLSAEYCVAIYRTRDDWRVSKPVRKLVGEQRACDPPYGGVDDVDYGRQTFVVGFAHNHPCDLPPSTNDLGVFPVALIQGAWEAVQFATDSEGRPVLIDGKPVPVAGWLSTANGRLLRWNIGGRVEEWTEGEQQWHFIATCKLPEQSVPGYQPPRCTPPLR